jgi:hypothetical protein
MKKFETYGIDSKNLRLDWPGIFAIMCFCPFSKAQRCCDFFRFGNRIGIIGIYCIYFVRCANFINRCYPCTALPSPLE